MSTPETASDLSPASYFERARSHLFRGVTARRNLRILLFAIAIVAVAGSGWAAYYAYDRGFTKRWRKSIIRELAKHGIVTTIGRLTLDPVEGLVARNVFLYDDPKRKRLLAKINRISLDIDFAKLIRDEHFLSKIDFKNADLSLPLDPEREDGDALSIRDFSAKILIENDGVEITRASGLLGGVEFSVRGSLFQSPASSYDVANSAKSILNARREALKKRRTAAHRVAEALERFQFLGIRPRVDIEISGDVADSDSLRAKVAFSGTEIARRDYAIRAVKGALEIQRGEISLQHLMLNDDVGELHLSGVHTIGSRQVKFHIDSSAGIHRLLRALSDRFDQSEVTFGAAPTITARGAYDWTAATFSGAADTNASEFKTAGPFNWRLPIPFDVTGSVSCDDFECRGARIGASFDFSVDHENLYFRNISIDDENSGTLGGNFLITPGESHYDARVRMDPTILSPFLTDGALKKWLTRFRFNEDSSVQVEFEGHSTAATGYQWEHSVDVDLRDFYLSGRKIDNFECDAAITAENMILTDVRVEQAQAPAFEEKATWTFADRKLTLTSLTSALDPVSTVGIFSPALAERLQPYAFDSPPNLQIKGTIFPHSLRDCDLSIVLTSRGGSRCTVADYDLAFDGVAGNLQLKDGILSVNLSGKSTKGAVIHGLTLNDAAALAFAGRFPVADNVVVPPAYKVVADAASGAAFRLRNVDFPMQYLKAEVVSEGQRTQLNATASVFDGEMEVSVTVPRKDLPGYKANVKAERVDFGRLARRLNPEIETTGSLDVLASFSGVADAPASIDGDGSLILHDGNIFAIPILGSLSPIIARLYRERPTGHGVAHEATATFGLRGGRLTTDDFTASTDAFTLHGAGNIDLDNDRVDLDASLKARRASASLLHPISGLFRFSASGTIAAPQWQRLEDDNSDAVDPSGQ